MKVIEGVTAAGVVGVSCKPKTSTSLIKRGAGKVVVNHCAAPVHVAEAQPPVLPHPVLVRSPLPTDDAG